MRQTFVQLLLLGFLLSGSVCPAVYAENVDPEKNTAVLNPLPAETATEEDMTHPGKKESAILSRLSLGGYGEAVMSLIMPMRSGLEYPDTIVCL